MRYYNKTVYPKEVTENDPEFRVWVKKSIARNLVDAVLDNMKFDETDDCINYPEVQDKNGWVTEFVGSIDISVPTKLMAMGSVYVCENCFSKNEVPASYRFSYKFPKYCFNCGGHFTNIYRENDHYLIKEKTPSSLAYQWEALGHFVME